MDLAQLREDFLLNMTNNLINKSSGNVCGIFRSKILRNHNSCFQK